MRIETVLIVSRYNISLSMVSIRDLSQLQIHIAITSINTVTIQAIDTLSNGYIATI